MYVNTENKSSFNFTAPTGKEGKNEVLFPVSETLTPDYAAAVEVPVAQMLTNVNVTATGDVEFSADVDAQVSEGAELILSVTASGGNRAVSFDSDTIDSDMSVTIAQNATKKFLCKYIGGKFYLVSIFDNIGETTEVADDSVTTAKIAAKAVTLAKMADGVAAGDIMWYNGTAWVILPKGTDGQVLKMVSGAPAWATDAVS